MTAFKPWALLGAAALALSTSPSTSAATIELYEYAFNLDGVITNSAVPSPLPSGVNIAGFDTTTGLGQITITFSGVGNHYVGLFVDHEIDEGTNTFFNETGSATGAAVAGLSWEVDEPGYVLGDIYDNFIAGTLGNDIGFAQFDDVSMALGWNFTLASDETASIDFSIALAAPGGGFYLTQFDPDSQASLYFSSALTIRGGGTPIPEPGSLALVALGLAGAWQTRRRQGAATLAP